MGEYTVQKTSDVGIQLAFVAVAGSDIFVNDGKTIVLVNNADVSVNNVTIITTKTIAGLAVANRPVVVAAGEIESIGPFPPSLYGDPVTINYSNTTTNTAVAVSSG